GVNMNDCDLSLQELDNESGEPRIALILRRGGQVVLRQEARVFSEDDIIAAGNALAGAGPVPQVDIDQGIAGLIEPIRIKWLRTQDRQPDNNPAEGPQAAVPRYVAVLPGADGAEPREPSVRDLHGDRVLANFVLTLDEDIEAQDDIESRREFAG